MSKMVNRGLYSSVTDEWETPQELFNELNQEFHFTLDPCASANNHKCEKWYSRSDDGLSKSWSGETVFVNPPYGSEIQKWVAKCAAENEGGWFASCFFRQEQTQGGFMSISITKRKSDLLKDALDLATPNGMHRFRQ